VARASTPRRTGGLLAAGLWFAWYAIDAKGARGARRALYGLARTAGDAGPWATGDVRRIVRRHVHRALGRNFGRWAYGGGALSRAIKSILGV
jgi:hypothetical protein